MIVRTPALRWQRRVSTRGEGSGSEGQMRDRWYVVPAECGGKSGGSADDGELALMLFLHPTAGSIWPPARSLPRRLKGRTKR